LQNISQRLFKRSQERKKVAFKNQAFPHFHFIFIPFYLFLCFSFGETFYVNFLLKTMTEIQAVASILKKFFFQFLKMVICNDAIVKDSVCYRVNSLSKTVFDNLGQFQQGLIVLPVNEFLGN
jgi:hypothetical protein